MTRETKQRNDSLELIHFDGRTITNKDKSNESLSKYLKIEEQINSHQTPMLQQWYQSKMNIFIIFISTFILFTMTKGMLHIFHIIFDENFYMWTNYNILTDINQTNQSIIF